MTWTTLALGKWIMTDRKEQSFGRAAMGIMASETGITARTNILMDAEKTGIIDVMTISAERPPIFLQNTLGCRSMGIMAGGAVFPGRLMGNALLPVSGDLLMTAEAEVGLIFLQDFRLVGTMSSMAGAAALVGNRGMNVRCLGDGARHVSMTGKTQFSGIAGQIVGKITGMGRMAGSAIFPGKRFMRRGRCRRLFQGLMAGKAQLAAGLRLLQKFSLFPLMRIMAPAAVATGKGGMQAEAAHIARCCLMAGQTENLFVFNEQFFLVALVRLVTIKTFPLRCGRMPASAFAE